MLRIDEREEVLIPPHPFLDAIAERQDLIAGIVRKYVIRKRRRTLFRQITNTVSAAIITSAGLIYVLRAFGLL